MNDLVELVRVSFFFFQAEDGIRDTSVTGVQTCALPISHPNVVNVFAVDELHHDVRPPVALAGVEDVDDVRMREPRGKPGLAQKALPELFVPREVLSEQLDGDRAVEPGIACFVDGRHPAVSERSPELVPADPHPGMKRLLLFATSRLLRASYASRGRARGRGPHVSAEAAGRREPAP